MQKFDWTCTILCATLMSLATGCIGNSGVDIEAEAKKPLPVKVLKVNRVTSKREVGKFVGSIRSARKSPLSFTRGGQLDRLQVQVGDQVQQGQLLAELLQPRLIQKRDSISKALKDKKDRQMELEAVPSTLEERRQLIAKLRLELDQLDAAVAAQATPDRLSEIQKQVAQLNRQASASELAELKQQISSLEAELKDIEIQINEGRLTAPYTGQIAARYFDEGAVVGQGRPVFELIDQKRIASVGIPSQLAAQVQVGAAVFITVDEKVQSGAVRAILPELDASARTRTIQIELENQNPDVVSGMVATMLIWIDAPKTGFWVPTSSLNRDANGAWSVYRAETKERGEAVIVRVGVQVLRQDQEWVLVAGVLQDNDLIVESGTHRVVPSQRVVTEVSNTRKLDEGGPPIDSKDATDATDAMKAEGGQKEAAGTRGVDAGFESAKPAEGN